MKLFTDSVASRRDVRDHGTLRANNAAFPAATALLRGTAGCSSLGCPCEDGSEESLSRVGT